MPPIFRYRAAGAFSLLEVMFAATCFVISIVGIFAVYSSSLQVLRTTDQNAICSRNLLQRADQIRRTSWANATNPVYLSSTNILGKQIDATAKNLPSIVDEYVAVSAAALPYASPIASPTPTPSATPIAFKVTRSGSTVTVSPSPASSMYSQNAVQITVGIDWLDQSGRKHNREISTIVSNAGITK